MHYHTSSHHQYPTRPPSSSSYTSSMSAVSGIQGHLLEITVVGCNKLKDTEWISRQDPYVCLEYESTKFRTRTHTDGGKNPTFQEKFVFTLIEGLRELDVHVWNSNTLTYDDFIGSGKVQLQKVLTQGFDDTPWTIHTKTDRFSGEVRLIMHYANAKDRAAPTAPPYGAPPQVNLYGAPPVSAVSSYPPPSAYPSPSPYPSAYPPNPYPSVAYPSPYPHNASVYPPQAYPPAPYPPQPYPPPPQQTVYPLQPYLPPYPPQPYPPPQQVVYPPQAYPPAPYHPQFYPCPQQASPYHRPATYLPAGLSHLVAVSQLVGVGLNACELFSDLAFDS